MKNERPKQTSAQFRSLDQRLLERPELAEKFHALMDQMEESLTEGAKLGRPPAARLKPGAFSRKVRRAMVDFGAEDSFAKAAERMREHHGLEVRAEAVRQETYRQARELFQFGKTGPSF